MKVKAQKASKCMGSVSLKVQCLMKEFPPRFLNQRKKEYFEKAFYYHRKQAGIIKVTRWTFDDSRKSPLDLTKHDLEIVQKKGFYTYEESDGKSKIWWVNFADENLFGFYGSDLFAQDEIQTLEHPLLGSVAEYLKASRIPGLAPRTVEKNKVTPYLVENVPYWISVNVNPVLSNGEKGNIYGRNFFVAEQAVVEQGISIIQRDIKNNIIAMAAPRCGSGLYTESQLQMIMETVIVAFGAAVKRTTAGRYSECVINTGNWGCGAFGNNKELMYVSQILAASFVGVDRLIFHNPDEEMLNSAIEKIKDLDSDGLFSFLERQRYEWQVSDGN